MKWIYIAIGIIVLLYVGQMIQGYVSVYQGDIQIIKSGVEP